MTPNKLLVERERPALRFTERVNFAMFSGTRPGITLSVDSSVTQRAFHCLHGFWASYFMVRVSSLREYMAQIVDGASAGNELSVNTSGGLSTHSTLLRLQTELASSCYARRPARYLRL